MAKSRRKVSASQRDKIAIARAKALKKAGILGAKTNLHSGRYISRHALKKVRELGALAGTNVKAYKAPKEIVARAKQRGFITIGGTKVVGPKTATFRANLAKGEIVGVQCLKRGTMEVIDLSNSIYDLHSLYEAMGDDGLNSLKCPDEVFAFRLGANMSYKVFPNVQTMRSKLFNYESIQSALAHPDRQSSEFAGISLIRFHKEDETLFIFGRTKREMIREAYLAHGIDKTGRTMPKRKRYSDNPFLKSEAMKKAAEYKAKKRAERTPAKKALDNAKALARMNKLRGK